MNIFSSCDKTPTFSNLAEETKFWKLKATELEKAAQKAAEELVEFQEGSRELEDELEVQLKQAEFEIDRLKVQSNRLLVENEKMKEKLEQRNKEFDELQTKFSELRNTEAHQHKYVRELEQQNDNLERIRRSNVASLEDSQSQINAAIERNAFLESELEETESLNIIVQRLTDETRDLRSELKVLQQQIVTKPENNQTYLQTFVDLDNQENYSEFLLHQNSESPHAKKSSLKILGEIFRKVGNLKLNNVKYKTRRKNSVTSLKNFNRKPLRRVLPSKYFKRWKLLKHLKSK